MPFIKSDHETNGWDKIGSVISDSDAKIHVDMNGAAIVPGEILDKIKGNTMMVRCSIKRLIVAIQ